MIYQGWAVDVILNDLFDIYYIWISLITDMISGGQWNVTALQTQANKMAELEYILHDELIDQVNINNDNVWLSIKQRSWLYQWGFF